MFERNVGSICLISSCVCVSAVIIPNFDRVDMIYKMGELSGLYFNEYV